MKVILAFSVCLALFSSSAKAEFLESNPPAAGAFWVRGNSGEFDYPTRDAAIRSAKERIKQRARETCGVRESRRVSEFSVGFSYGVYRVGAWYQCRTPGV